MRPSRWALVVLFFGISMLATSVSNAGGTGGVSLSGGFTPIGVGDAGSGAFAPAYNDAFDIGWIGRIEPFYDFTPLIRGQFGVAYNKWGGKTYNAVRFEDLAITTFYLGIKIRFLPNSSVRPYVVADIGAARLSSVDVVGLRGPGVQSEYWSSTTTAFLDIGGGVEFRVAPKVSFFFDLRAQGTGAPSSGDPPFSDADGIGSLPVTAGVNISF